MVHDHMIYVYPYIYTNSNKKTNKSLAPFFCGLAAHVRRRMSLHLQLKKTSATHRNASVGPIVIIQVAIEDVRYITDDAQIGSIILTCKEE